MRVSFTKDHRRYGVYVHRDEAPDLWLVAPCSGDELPHDLLHFVAEAELGPTTRFQPVDPSSTPRPSARSCTHELERSWHARTLPVELLTTLDELSTRWQELPVGASLTLDWPSAEPLETRPEAVAPVR